MTQSERFKHVWTCLDTVWTVLTCLNLSWHSLNCLNMSELVLTQSELFKHVWTCLDTVWTVLACLNLSWHSLNCLNMSELVLTQSELFKHVWTCYNIQIFSTKLIDIFHTNNQLISPVQVFRCLDWKIYFCIISACNCRFKSNEKNIAC